MIELKIKELYFDAKKIREEEIKANRRALQKAAAFVYVRERSIIRTSKKTAAPGEPPRSHEGSLKKLIRFAVDEAGTLADIGPQEGGGDDDAPHLAEFGGDATRFHTRVAAGPEGRAIIRGHRYTAHYQKHPFAEPSLRAEIDAGTIARSWEGSIHG